MAVLDRGAAVHLRDHAAIIDIRRFLIVIRCALADQCVAVVLGDEFLKDNVFQRSIKAAEQAVVVFIAGIAGIVHVAVRVHVAHAGDPVHTDQAASGIEGPGSSGPVRRDLSVAREKDSFSPIVRDDDRVAFIDTAVQLAVKALAAIPEMVVEAAAGKIQILGQTEVVSVRIRVADRAEILPLAGNILPEVHRDDAFVRRRGGCVGLSAYIDGPNGILVARLHGIVKANQDIHPYRALQRALVKHQTVQRSGAAELVHNIHPGHIDLGRTDQRHRDKRLIVDALRADDVVRHDDRLRGSAGQIDVRLRGGREAVRQDQLRVHIFLHVRADLKTAAVGAQHALIPLVVVEAAPIAPQVVVPDIHGGGPDSVFCIFPGIGRAVINIGGQRTG